MPRSRMVIALFTMIASVLTACGAQPTEAGVPTIELPMPAADTPEATAEAIPTVTEEAGIIPVTGDPNPARLSNLMHLSVLNQAGQQLGEVRDIILDLNASGISYLLVSSGGFLNVEEKQVAVPWSAVQVQTGSDATGSGFFTLTADEQLFVNAPEINLEHGLPGMGEVNPEWDEDLRTYWGLSVDSEEQPPTTVVPSTLDPLPGTLQPTPEGTPLSGILLASEALGFDFKLQGQEALDVSIDDMIINIQTGKILYMVIHTNFENAREQWVPIPYSLLQWDPTARDYILNVDMVTLQSAPFYIDSLYPDTTRPGWDDIYVFFWKEHGLTSRP